jgi:nitronate monooxygenase
VDLPWAVPLMQAPIGPASTPELVSAVSNTGALGTLAASWTDPATLRAQIRQIRGTTDRPWCINLVLAFDQRDRLEVAIEEGAPFVSFSWGVHKDMIRRAQGGGATVLVQVGNVSDAIDADAAGVDIVIAQGVEAGGHVQSISPVLGLVRDARRSVTRPIVAAGGIGDAEAASRAVAAGADGVACGTAFLAAHEADVHPRYLDRLIHASRNDTVLTGLFEGGWPDAPHRVLRNATVARWEEAARPHPGVRPGEGQVVAHRDGHPILRYSDAQPTRSATGDVDAMAMYAGLSVGSVQRSEGAAEIAQRIAKGLS